MISFLCVSWVCHEIWIVCFTIIRSAAHCFLSISPVPLKDLRLVLGDLNINITTETDHEFAEVESIIFHSHFDPYFLENDIALIKVKKNIKFRRGIQPVCLPEQGMDSLLVSICYHNTRYFNFVLFLGNSYAGKDAVVTGWGAVFYPMGKLATQLQYLSTVVIENSECKNTLKIDYVHPTMLCSSASGCSGTCFGDRSVFTAITIPNLL